MEVLLETEKKRVSEFINIVTISGVDFQSMIDGGIIGKRKK